MTCQEVAEFLMAYVDGEISEDRRAIFEEHLGECPDCVNYLSSYRETIQLIRETGVESPDVQDEIPEDLVRAILAARQSEK
jgi:anti-sigma factor RsiW